MVHNINTSPRAINPARPKDPNVLQRIASDPKASVWVGASAGSGKTKVLTDRILRLLLPNQSGDHGTAPQKILALTFTKAAACEMALRIQDRLSQWATMPQNDEGAVQGLIDNLKNLLGHTPTDQQIETARQLFAQVVDTPGGLKIMTIHSFCQSILGRFPLEADLPPAFQALDETQAQLLLKQARQMTFEQAQNQKGSPLSDAIFHLASLQNEDQFLSLLQSLVSERNQLQQILKTHFGIDGLYTALCQQFDLPAGITEQEIVTQACDPENIHEDDLWTACKALAESSKKTDNEKACKIQKWLEHDQAGRIAGFAEYSAAYLTRDLTIFKKLVTKGVIDKNPDVQTIMEIESQRVFNIQEKIKAVTMITATRDLFQIGQQILTHYNDLKLQKSTLDFDDLILKTLHLLQGQTHNLNGLDTAPWVRYKMDQGIDHILVDEAQDTNPEQWNIIQSLCDDFFDSDSPDENPRTIFVVGDEKQSIFSFQRASPEKFREMRAWFEDKITNAQKRFEPVDFITSFRSVKSVLALVDKVFEDEKAADGLGIEPIKHESFRYTQPGLVELWPVFENPEKPDYDPWAPPTEIIESTCSAQMMANHTAQTIAGWIENKETLESYDRPIEAGDILILVRSRTAFIDQLVRSLKSHNVPVSGVDRMVLSEQLCVQDLCAAAQFALLPEDDLTLAGFLKSPFIGFSEEQLFDIAYKRDGSLWGALKQNSTHKNITDWLSTLIQRSGKLAPYEFFSMMLQQSCPADSISGLRAIKSRLGEDALDPMDEFLNQALNFEREETPNLQNFIQAQIHSESQIKRQMEEGGSAVRIMTVHGAKGLQAPIVIMPDCARSGRSNKSDRILWPDRSGDDLPYFCAQAKLAPARCKDAIDILKQRQDAEHRRLLYVALTRAENRLYMGGYMSGKNLPDDSWHHYILNGFDRLDNVDEFSTDNGEIIKRYSNPATDDKADRADKDKPHDDVVNVTPPAWLYQPMPEEPFPPRPLAPSRPSEVEMPALSPLKSADNQRFLRGNITHKLLQILPDLPEDHREAAAQKYVSQPAHGLSEGIQANIVSEIMDILNNPEFSEIFGANSMAEAPISGLLDQQTLISGQIDRLLITNDEILIIDYKTNRPPPLKVEDVPAIYKNQMRAYRQALAKIYPTHKIRTALIWTDGARLMEIDAA